MKTEQYKTNIENLEKNLELDEDGNLRINHSICFGRYFPALDENVFMLNYQEKIKSVLKEFRNYPNGNKVQEWNEIYLEPVFSPAFLAYNTLSTEKPKLKLSGWEVYSQKSNSQKGTLHITIPTEDTWIYDNTNREFSKSLINQYARQIDNIIRNKIEEKQNSLIGRIKRKSFKKIIPFQNLDFEFQYKNPKIEMFENKGADCISGPWNPEENIWRLD